MAGALPEICRLRIQIYHATCGAHCRTAVPIQYGTATRGDHHFAGSTQLGNHLRLAGTEAGFAFNFENHRHLHAGALLDLVVGVMKRPAECPCQQATNGGLACAHQADENDVIGHDSRFYQSPLRQKKAGQQPGLSGDTSPVTELPSGH